MVSGKKNQKNRFIDTVLAFLAATVICLFASATVLAASDPCHPKPPEAPLTADQLKSCEACNSAQANANNCLQNNVLVKDIQLLVDVLSAGVGVVVVGSLIVGGIQYSFAGDNPQATSAAKNRIINSLLALAAFFLIFAFLQWIIPGGLFS
jgi:hypothetical protein